jgi:uncharacterized OB-fold protein
VAEPFEIEKEFVRGAFTKPLSPDSSLIASKCMKCGKLHFPPQRLCSACYAWEEMENTPLSRRGKIFSWTVSYMMGTHPIGYVDLPEGVRVFAIFTDVGDDPTSALDIGQEVEMVVTPMREMEFGMEIGATEFVGYKFRPIR